MAIQRDNCIILLIEPPVPERVSPELAGAFGPERAVHINLDLLQNVYKLVKNFKDALLILSYDKSPRHPDLTWLDHDDPGFLEAKGKNLEGRIADAFQLAFNTGAKKALLLSHLSPGVKPEWLNQALESVSEKQIVLGLNQNRSVYLAGLTINNLKVLGGIRCMSQKTADELSEKAKRSKLSIFQLPEAYAVENEETLRKWLEARDAAPSLFMKEPARAPEAAAAPAQPRQEEKKHGRRSHKNSTPTPPI